jgi:hypothetical protein
MILDIASDFLSPGDWEEIWEMCPGDEQWIEAVVHRRRNGEDRVNKKTRKAYKCVENRHDFIDRVQRHVMASILPRLREQEGFLYCWPRGHRGTEWLRYKPGMFFRPHTDFERYICGGLRPYVCLLGMKDVEEGGETRVDKTMCVGGARKNGMVFFPATELHEAVSVIRGEKICLKMEFFVVMASPDLLSIHSRSGWRSTWSKSAIDLFDNYLRSHLSFSSTSTSTSMVVSEKTAQEFQQLMMAIAEARVRECEMYFPTLSTRFLHDVFACHEYLGSPHRTSATKIIMGNDDNAWEYMNSKRMLPNDARLMVGLWFKKAGGGGDSAYRLFSTFSRLGSSSITTETATNRYRPYTTIHRHALESFIYFQDMSIDKLHPLEDEDTIPGTDLPLTNQSLEWSSILQNIQPSDRLQKKIRKQGTVITTETEMCNDEDAGTISETYETYVSFDIQIRWFLYAP